MYMENSETIPIGAKKESKSRRFFVVVTDLLLVLLSIAIFLGMGLKYLCSGPSGYLFPVNYLFFGAIAFLGVSFLRPNTDGGKKMIIWVRALYLLVWLIYIIRIILVPAIPVGSC